MELDKIAYITLACLTGLIIILVIAFGTYGSNISKDPSFIMFFKWYIFLFVFNLFNILVTLIFHYIMADIPGEKGLKGFTGDRGLPGESSKCFCQYNDTITINAKDIDLNKNIHTRDVMGPNKIDRIGTIIYDGEKDEKLTIEHQNAIQQLNKQVAEDVAEAAAARKAEAFAAANAAVAAADAAIEAANVDVLQSYNWSEIFGVSHYIKILADHNSNVVVTAAEQQLIQSVRDGEGTAIMTAAINLSTVVKNVLADLAGQQ